MQVASGLFGGGSVVKTVQRGSLSIMGTNSSSTATVTAVDTSKTILLISTSGGSEFSNTLVRAQVTNSTTLTFRRAGGGANISVEWQLIEYK
jgi:hypothetical protein